MGQRKTLTLIATLLVPYFATAEPQNELGVLLEPSFAAPKIFHPVKDAQKTVLVPARNSRYGVDSFTEAEWEAENLGWPEVLPTAMKLADSLVKQVEPRWIRDERDVILYGIIEDRHPFISSILFSDAFHERLKSSLGAEFLVLVPDRNTLFLFPKYGGRLEDYSASIVERYHRAPIKVSLEIFEVDASGCRVVGAIGQ